ncbi:PREDICTED: uncharacterized protein LOC106750875 isoform X2 [Dinoponera quadriceps]|uniref:Uncharacterized protein LOC106750875 isoform X2 n=1 Tax=Dinoponera quadriceps TaxID=609295 RepID=A0A6P3Y7T9_DINQU|nr:PREDICTED: uncharacterized protein LOC106750875 isoform X2 [Dinoponera quadriceps]
MKTLVVILSVLSVTTAVYGLNKARLRMFNDNIAKCKEEIGGTATELTVEPVICAIEKDGKILNSKGEYIKDATMQVLEDGISNANTLEKAQGMFTKCYDDGVQSGSTGWEQTIKIGNCSMPILSLFDKL